jgi:hypothetical protein
MISSVQATLLGVSLFIATVVSASSNPPDPVEINPAAENSEPSDSATSDAWTIPLDIPHAINPPPLVNGAPNGAVRWIETWKKLPLALIETKPGWSSDPLTEEQRAALRDHQPFMRELIDNTVFVCDWGLRMMVGNHCCSIFMQFADPRDSSKAMPCGA